MKDLLEVAPRIIAQLLSEFLRRGDEEWQVDQKSQATACLFLAIRSGSLLSGMQVLLDPRTRDSLEVLGRSFLEARDLLLTFRFDDAGARTKIRYWFEGRFDSSWKPDHAKCEIFIAKLDAGVADFAKSWSQMSTLAHPTTFAAHNSVVSARNWLGGSVPRPRDAETMRLKTADFLECVASLIVIGTLDLPGLIPLKCDPTRMPDVDWFQKEVLLLATPILRETESDLPPESYKS